MKHAVVIGAGLGGLGAGIHLLRDGWKVTILERNALPGGRMNRIEQQGFRIDTGPTLLMMPEVIENLFAGCGRRVEDYLKLRRLDPSYEVRFADGSRLAMGLPEHTAEAFKQFNARDGERLPELLLNMDAKYRLGRNRFIECQFNSLRDLLHPRTLGGFAKAVPIDSVWNYIAGHISDPRLRQALTFQTLYLGTSPFTCPSIYGFLPYIEMKFGVWFPEGGMYAIADSLRKLFLELGGQLECNAHVRKIRVESGCAQGVEVDRGAFLSADVVVSNCDVQTTYTQLIDGAHRRKNTDQRMWKLDSGCSGYLLYLGVRNVPKDWRHHTVILPHDYAGVMSDIFERRILPREPAVYTCVPTRSDPSLAPRDHHVLYILAPVPHVDAHVTWDQAAPILRQRCLRAMAEVGWPDLEEQIVLEREWTPFDFMRHFGLFRGSAFGLLHTFWQSAYFRPHNRSEDVKNLYLVGASTHPGGGVPIVLTSAWLVADRIQRDQCGVPSRAPRVVVPMPARRVVDAE